jgi:hypothetical protein
VQPIDIVGSERELFLAMDRSVTLTADQIDSIEVTIDRMTDRSEVLAIFTGEYLRLWCRGLKVRAPKKWPARFLLDLSAILELDLWQRSPVVPAGLTEFPAAESLLDELWNNFFGGTYATACGEPTQSPLQLALSRAWYESSCWASLPLGAPLGIAASDCSDEEMLDLLAELLWQHRHLA